MEISVVIPVYNVYEWMDECFESIHSQTFTDFEVILINDGSTDGSEKKCMEWAQRDERFRVITQKNTGPSIARNNGIKKAKGKYLSFIDADDWVDKNFLKKLYEAAVMYNADIVECDVYRVDNRTKEKIYHNCSGNMGMDYSKSEHMKYGHSAIWKCLFRRELFEKYQVQFPNCHSEAKAIYPLLLALSQKTVNVKEALYYYRRFRENSLTAKPRTNNGDELAIGLRAFDALVEGFKKNNIFEEYEKLLQEIVTYKLSDMLAMSFYRREKEIYFSLVKQYREYLIQKFPNVKSDSYITWGGYNLNRVLWNMNILHDAYCRFNFSSLISVMTPVAEKINYTHKNAYRRIMLDRDIKSSFWQILEETKPQYLIMDFIEERFDILEFKTMYITKSDAFDTAETSLAEMKVISRKSEECTQLWKDSCKRFVEKITVDYPNVKIVLVKNFLCENYGDVTYSKKYENLEEIREINELLGKYYDFFEENCSNAIVVEASKCEPYMTDVDYEYGNLPSHLNEIVNRKIALQIEKALSDSRYV